MLEIPQLVTREFLAVSNIEAIWHAYYTNLLYTSIAFIVSLFILLLLAPSEKRWSSEYIFASTVAAAFIAAVFPLLVALLLMTLVFAGIILTFVYIAYQLWSVRNE